MTVSIPSLVAAVLAIAGCGASGDTAGELDERLIDALDFEGGEVVDAPPPEGSDGESAPQLTSVEAPGAIRIGGRLLVTLGTGFGDPDRVVAAIVTVGGAGRHIRVTGDVTDGLFRLAGRVRWDRRLAGSTFALRYALQTEDGITGLYRDRILGIAVESEPPAVSRSCVSTACEGGICTEEPLADGTGCARPGAVCAGGLCLSTVAASAGHHERSIAVTTDGSLLAHGLLNGDVVLTRTDTLETVLTIPNRQPSSIAFSADSSLLVAAGDSLESQINLWRVSDGELVRTIGTPGLFHATDVDVSPDGSLIATVHHRRGSTGSGYLKIWSAEDGSLLQTPVEGENPFNVHFSQDGTLIGTSGESGTDVWRIPGFEPLLATARSAYIYDFAFSPDNGLFVVPDNQGTIAAFDIVAGTEAGRITDVYTTQILFTPQSRMLTVPSPAGLRFYRDPTVDDQPVVTIAGVTGSQYLLVDPVGERFLAGVGLASGSADLTILWDLPALLAPNCDDGIDNDRDGRQDAADPECEFSGWE